MLTKESSQFRLAERLRQAFGRGQQVILFEAFSMRAENDPDIVLIAASGRSVARGSPHADSANPPINM
jgi:hypothetical protein